MPSLAGPHGQMRGFARLRNRTLYWLTFSTLGGILLGVIITAASNNDVIWSWIGIGIALAGLLVGYLADEALRERNASWRPMSTPSQIADITRTQITHESAPADVVSKVKVAFTDASDIYYTVVGALSDDVTIGSRVVGDIRVSDSLVCRLQVVY